MRVCEYVDCNRTYSEREGASILTVFVISSNEVYEKRMIIDKVNNKMKNRVVIR